MKYLWAIFVVIVVVTIINSFIKRRNFNKRKKSLNENWGNSKAGEYYDFDLIGKYFYNATASIDNFYQVVSDKIRDDLNMDSLFQFIDRTSSKIGQQYLYYKLRTLNSDVKTLKKFDSLVELMSSDISLRQFCQVELQKLNSPNVYYLEEIIHGKEIKKPKWAILVYLLSAGAIIDICLAFKYPVALLLLLPIYIVNMVIHYLNKRNVGNSFITVAELLKSINIAEKISQQASIKNYFDDLSFLKTVSKLKYKTHFIRFEQRVDNDITLVVSFLTDLIKIMFNIEVLSYYSFIDSLNKTKKNIDRLFKYLGEIDAAISVASLRKGTEIYCKPVFLSNKKVHYADISHPLIEKFVPNSLTLEDQSLLLTGSNMSGKTTFIRTIAINTIMAQTLYTCFAKEYISPFLKIYSSIRISDDLLEGKSYYLQEVLAIKQFIDECSKEGNCLFILDEIFKGTNTLERISGGKAILSYLNKDRHVIFVSTHDIELTELLSKENYSLYHFEEHIEKNELTFDYKLKEGPLTTRNAIKILELYNYPPEIIADANATIGHLS
jgi:DNA mismatch repair ATPase MutS